MSVGSAPGLPPTLRVVRGEPTDEELAALLAVLTARQATLRAAGGGAATRGGRRPGWAARALAVRRPLRPGRGAWRRSARSLG